LANYYEESTDTWTSVAPVTTGQNNNNFSCKAACQLTNLTANGPIPAQIDYVVCGNDINGCLPVINIHTPTVSIAQESILFCPEETNVIVHVALLTIKVSLIKSMD
jgi:hypothetical protein